MKLPDGTDWKGSHVLLDRLGDAIERNCPNPYHSQPCGGNPNCTLCQLVMDQARLDALLELYHRATSLREWGEATLRVEGRTWDDRSDWPALIVSDESGEVPRRER